MAMAWRAALLNPPNFIFFKFSFECNKNLLVNERTFPVNTTWLSICSLVFAAMFQVDMKERDAIDIEICDVTSANYFEDFLAMISPDRHLLINRRFLFFKDSIPKISYKKSSRNDLKIINLLVCLDDSN